MSWPLAKLRVTVASRPARLPPLAVTSYTVEAVSSLTLIVAVVLLTAKSAAPTFRTFSLKVTRQVRLSALVGEAFGVCRAIEVTVGAGSSLSAISTDAAPLALAPPPPRLRPAGVPRAMARVSEVPSSVLSSTAVRVRVATRTASVLSPAKATAGSAAL